LRKALIYFARKVLIYYVTERSGKGWDTIRKVIFCQKSYSNQLFINVVLEMGVEKGKKLLYFAIDGSGKAYDRHGFIIFNFAIFKSNSTVPKPPKYFIIWKQED
jgi:hypothetical protein